VYKELAQERPALKLTSETAQLKTPALLRVVKYIQIEPLRGGMDSSRNKKGELPCRKDG